MGEFVARHDLGEVFTQDWGFKIKRDRDTVCAPDVAFVARERLAGIPEEGYAEIAPDWVAEILSPVDRPGEVLEKVGQWLSLGVRLVWFLDPVRRDARIYRADGTVSTVGPDGELDGKDVLPGFRVPLATFYSRSSVTPHAARRLSPRIVHTVELQKEPLRIAEWP